MMRRTSCAMPQLCQMEDLPFPRLSSDGKPLCFRQQVERNHHLFHAGDPFRLLYVVKTGYFKSYLLRRDGYERVIGFQMEGDMIGFDGIESGFHSLHVVALEDGEVCMSEFSHAELGAASPPALQVNINRIMGRELSRAHEVIMTHGYAAAEARVAVFLLELSKRQTERGYAPHEVKLLMTRAEIGSYLGLRQETVSRTIARFQLQGLLTTCQKSVQLHDLYKLEQLSNPDMDYA
ncbi:transcriptional regulator [Janthinobacterium sp. BJB412]|nr:transcriptional regulator [Janthinobacterium sp. BJB412]